MTGTYTRHRTNTSGQLRSLEDRMSDKAFERRTQKMVTRVGRDHAVTRGLTITMLQLLQRGFFGRMKWLFLGK